MRNSEKFAVFILTHGRAKKVETYKTLRDEGYSGDIYLIVDDKDDQVDDYRELYGDEVIVFDKEASKADVDLGDLSTADNVVVFARNQCHRIAANLGIDYFLELDDDYSEFVYRYIDGASLPTIRATNLDAVFEAFVDFLELSGAKTVAMAQAGDFMGGANGNFFHKKLARKAMNSFFCKTDRPFRFYGRLNEDTTMYALLGQRGELIFTATECSLRQQITQRNAGGLTDAYLEMGTYVKSFYSVMWCPSCVKVRMMGVSHQRMHHMVQWNNCAPKILSGRYRKPRP